MANDPQVFKYDDMRLRSLLRALESDHFVRVGVFGGDHKEAGEKKKRPNKYGGRKASKQSSGLTNADVGWMLEYGRKLPPKQPARSWLYAPLDRLMSSEDKIGAIAKKFFDKMVESGDQVQFLKELGIAAENEIQLAFDHGGPGWRKNAKLTVEIKGSDAPGIDTGQLRRAVASEVI